MPSVKNDPTALRALVSQRVSDKCLSQADANEVLAQAARDGITAQEGAAVVDGLVEALEKDSLDLTGVEQQAATHSLLGALDAQSPLPLDKSAAAPLPDGTVNYSKLLALQAEAKTQRLATSSFGGAAVGVDKRGELTLDRRRVPLELGHPTEATLEALWTLARPAQLSGLSEVGAKALQQRLVEAVGSAAATPVQDPDKFKRLAAICAGTAALSEVAAQWSPQTVNAMLQIAEESPNPMTRALARRGLDAAPLDEAQRARRDVLPEVEDAEELLEAFDKTRSEKAGIGVLSFEGPAAELTLSAMTFASGSAGVANLLETFKEWDQLEKGPDQTFSKEELGQLRTLLEGYVQKSEQTGFLFGTLKNNAPKDRAAIASQRAFAQIEPELKADPPSLQGCPLTRSQADFILGIAPNVRDLSAVGKMVQCLAMAQGIFKESLPPLWPGPSAPNEPLDPAAFALFERVAADYQDCISGKADGKLEYSDLLNDLSREAAEIHASLAPRLRELKARPPSWEGVRLSPEAAGYLEAQARHHLRSSMSVDNLGRALKVWSEKSGGNIEGASFEQFRAMVEEYKASWPKLSTFDFNKLERIASFKVAGKEVPLCTLNGQQTGLAEFYDKVALSVAGAFARDTLRHPWMADRWGYRAKQMVELMDVVAEQAARGEGPVAFLSQENPGKTVEILATGADGGHEQLLYSVKDPQTGLEVSRWAQGSDGALAPSKQGVEPILLAASVGKDGDLRVTVPDSIQTTRFPLQNPYTVGDKIDVHYEDDQAYETQVEGMTFETQWKVLEGEITGYDAQGNYTVRFKTPRGEEKTQTVPLSTLRKANNPHYFSPAGSSFADVSINVATDEALRTFLEEAKPIIQAHLPADGSMATMSPKELARRQKECIEALQGYASRIKYPQEAENTTDPNSKAFQALEQTNRFPLGELAKIQRGVCRHQCIFEHLLLQQAGIDSRLTSGAANTSGNDFRGYHLWAEVTLADNERYLSDQTWHHPHIPLWSGAYSVDRQRQEMYDRTAHFDRNIVN
ncbi:MAG: transglutaminase family protein [Deltaproteobacteria bacterium]|nr:transglutaminase family protein [Deltaproteobacteria bacterium]